MPFYHFCFVNYAKANQCTNLEQSKKHVEEDSDNTDHLNSHISNSILKKFQQNKKGSLTSLTT